MAMAMAIAMAKININSFSNINFNIGINFNFYCCNLQSRIISSPKVQHFLRDAFAETYQPDEHVLPCISHPSKPNL